jgi:hypothetical protein
MAGLMNTVSRLAGAASSVSRRRSTGTPGAGGMGRRRTGTAGPTSGGTTAGAASGLLSRFMKRR